MAWMEPGHHTDIDLKRIQMLKVDVASFSSRLLFAIITDILRIFTAFFSIFICSTFWRNG